MRIIQGSDKPWLVAKKVRPDGHTVISTGTEVRRVQYDRSWQAVRNVIFEATFSISLGGFTDTASGEDYHVSRTGPMRMIEAIADGRIRAEAGLISGRFTFEKMGETIFLIPAPAERAPRRAAAKPGPKAVKKEEVDDAPDITAFIPPRQPRGGV